MIERVTATEEALSLLNKIKNIHGSVLFYQSGGCCDGSAPMCYREGDFQLGDADVLLDIIDGTPFHMHKSQYEYWKHTQLILDATPGRGAEFSLDSIEEKHFITESRVFTDEEYKEVKKLL
ncbi:DUF779 domain-containing protein [Sporosarcina cascadiensis]|uniref:DUF779 domain-containing protein n=1 Tax=Sporosarcina cascadiensis TaxID=2660747 RepID=UPI00129A61A0|nr:DUF779 domain-containing protein [Sporosarcina cascadiensis]